MAPLHGDLVVESGHCYGGFRTRRLTVPGDGIPVVLLHGFGDTADTWRGVLTALGRSGRAAMAVDVRGFGVADSFTSAPLLPQLDEFIDAVLSETGPAVLVGNSLGVVISVRAAQRHPALIAGLVALDEPSLSADWRARLARGAFGRGARTFARRVPLPDSLARSTLRFAMRRLLYGDPRVADPAMIEGWSARYGHRAGVAWMVEHAIRFGEETRFGYPPDRVSCPALIMHGRRDMIVAPAAGLALQRLIPDSEFVLLPYAGHCPQLDRPAEIALVITDFVDKRSGYEKEVNG